MSINGQTEPGRARLLVEVDHLLTVVPDLEEHWRPVVDETFAWLEWPPEEWELMRPVRPVGRSWTFDWVREYSGVWLAAEASTTRPEAPSVERSESGVPKGTPASQVEFLEPS